MKNYKFTLNYGKAVSNGYLYNWYAATDVRNITSSDDWSVPSEANWDTLDTYLGTGAGGKLKALTGWNDPNTGATDEVGFGALGSGYRGDSTGGFLAFANIVYFWTQDESSTEESIGVTIAYNQNASGAGEFGKPRGMSIRLVRTAGVGDPENDGDYCSPYVGNNGQSYKTVRIGTQVWTAENLVETKYRNDDDIANVTDNAAWAALETGAYCAYDNDISNAFTGNFLELTHAPAGWDEKNITFSRHELYHSVFRSYSLSLRFVFEAIPFIMDAYESEGTNAIINIKIESINRSDLSYTDFYQGILDLSEMKIFPEWIEVPIIDSDIVSRFVAADDLELDIESSVNLSGEDMESIPLLNDVNIRPVDIITLAEAYGDGAAYVLAPRSFDFTSTWNPINFAYSVNEPGEEECNLPTFLYYNPYSYDVSLKVSLSCTLTGLIESGASDNNFDLRLRLLMNGVPFWNPIIQNYENIVSQSVNVVRTKDTFTFTVAPGSTVTIIGRLAATSVAKDGLYACNLTFNNWNIVLEIKQPSFPETTSKIAFLHEAFLKSLRKITSANDSLYSPLIGRTDSYPNGYGTDGQFGLLGICSGMKLRNFDVPLRIKFSDLFKTLNSITPVGLNYDGQWNILPIDSYYKESLIYDIGIVSELEIAVAEPLYFNSVRCGYPNHAYNDINGAKSFHCEMGLTNDISRIKRTYDIVSVYRADDYGIELTRRKQITDSKSEDFDTDSDVFIIAIRRDSTDFETRRSEGFTTSGVTNASTRMNIDITPKRNLSRHKKLLAPPVWKTSKEYINQGSKYNINIVIDDVSEVDNFNADESPLYIPEYYNFKAPVTTAIIQAMITDPHGYFAFTHLGTSYKGFIHEVSTEPFTRNGNFTLIKTPF